MTASGFHVGDGTPLLGRVLVAADEQAGAPSVAVLGYEVWRTRFGSDPNVLGRNVQLGTDRVTVVGVMREGFAFPVSHELWIPLRIGLPDQSARSGPGITVFGMLAPGATLETAQAELGTLGRRMAVEQPATHEHLQPRVTPYASLFFSAPSGEDLGIFFSIYFFAVMLLVLVCGNVALLMFARAATRESELVMRTALGASRSRIVLQLFAEALVLGGVAAVVGLAVADFALRNWGLEFLEVNLGRLPFWFDLRLSPATILFATGLTLLGSAIAGVMPALKVTRGRRFARRRSRPSSRRTSTCWRRRCSAAAPSMARISLPARASRSSIRASWTRCCRGGIRSASRCDSCRVGTMGRAGPPIPGSRSSVS